MKKLFLYISAWVTALLTVAGCEENQMDSYKNDPAVYFANSTEFGEQADSVNYSFFILPEAVKRDTVYVRVCTMGMPEAVDRPVRLLQTNVGKPDAAEAGVHFVAFDNAEVKDSLRIPAQAVFVDIPVIVLRDASLSLGVKRLELALVENDYFRLGIDEWRTFVVTISDLVSKPKMWDTRYYLFMGASWGPVKMRFLIKATGYMDWETVPTDMSYLTWMGNVARQALLEYNNANPTLREANGDAVSFDR